MTYDGISNDHRAWTEDQRTLCTADQKSISDHEAAVVIAGPKEPIIIRGVTAIQREVSNGN